MIKIELSFEDHDLKGVEVLGAIAAALGAPVPANVVRSSPEPTGAASQQTDAAPGEPAKRGRGRPPKNAVPPVDGSTPSADTGAEAAPATTEAPFEDPFAADAETAADTEDDPFGADAGRNISTSPENRQEKLTGADAGEFLAERIRPAMNSVLTKHGQAAAKGILDKTGYKNVSTIATERYREFLALAEFVNGVDDLKKMDRAKFDALVAAARNPAEAAA